jgi:Lrp/AsnC family leucine-responsive transcriptional regulator
MNLDAIERRLLSLLQANGRTSNAELARELDMAPSAVFERVRKLEARGLIAGYEARLAPKALELGLLAFVFVRAEERGEFSVGTKLAELEAVQEVHQVVGEDCYLVKVRARDTDDLARLLNREIKRVPGIIGTRTTIVLGSLKETLRLPLARPVPEAVTR